MKQTAASIYLDEKVKDYVLDIVSATRHPEQYKLKELKPLIEYGNSPRASINLCLAACPAPASSAVGTHVTPQDVKDVALDVLRHRVLLTYEAEAEETTSEDVVRKVPRSVPRCPEASSMPTRQIEDVLKEVRRIRRSSPGKAGE